MQHVHLEESIHCKVGNFLDFLRDFFSRELLSNIFSFANIIHRHAQDDKIALYFTTERRSSIGIGSMTFGQLKAQVARYSSALRQLGVTKGDRIVGYLPNCPEAIIAMAATASIGAVW